MTDKITQYKSSSKDIMNDLYNTLGLDISDILYKIKSEEKDDDILKLYENRNIIIQPEKIEAFIINHKTI